MKDDLRRINKAVNIAGVAIEGLFNAGRIEGVGSLPIFFSSMEKARNMGLTPHWVWRHDKPAIDKRRFRRYQRGGHVLP